MFTSSQPMKESREECTVELWGRIDDATISKPASFPSFLHHPLHKCDMRKRKDGRGVEQSVVGSVHKFDRQFVYDNFRLHCRRSTYRPIAKVHFGISALHASCR